MTSTLHVRNDTRANESDLPSMTTTVHPAPTKRAGRAMRMRARIAGAL